MISGTRTPSDKKCDGHVYLSGDPDHQPSLGLLKPTRAN